MTRAFLWIVPHIFGDERWERRVEKPRTRIFRPLGERFGASVSHTIRGSDLETAQLDFARAHASHEIIDVGLGDFDDVLSARSFLRCGFWWLRSHTIGFVAAVLDQMTFTTAMIARVVPVELS